jgi:hypothetical protein
MIRTIGACRLALVFALLCAPVAARAEQVPSEPPASIPLPVRKPATIPIEDVGTEAGPADFGDRGGPDRRRLFWTLLDREARKSGLPTDIADAVAAIESGYDPGAIGAVGEVGLMQVLPSTAAMLGFRGDASELAKPQINIRYGVTYLARAWQLANGDLCRALMKYRAGHGEEVMSPLSVNYCGRARAHLASVGSPFADKASVPLVYEPIAPRTGAARLGPKIRTASVSAAFWSAHEARIRAITNRIHAKWRKIAAR